LRSQVELEELDRKIEKEGGKKICISKPRTESISSYREQTTVSSASDKSRKVNIKNSIFSNRRL
jgi:hypothetical protein